MITYGLTAYVGHGDGGADLVVNCVELGQHDPVNRVRIVLQWDNSLILVPVLPYVYWTRVFETERKIKNDRLVSMEFNSLGIYVYKEKGKNGKTVSKL